MSGVEPEVVGWQPIKSAPKDGTIVLLWGIHETEWEDAQDDMRAPIFRPYPGYVSVQKDRWWMADGLTNIARPTHWMPLPSPPALTRATQKSALPNPLSVSGRRDEEESLG